MLCSRAMSRFFGLKLLLITAVLFAMAGWRLVVSEGERGGAGRHVQMVSGYCTCRGCIDRA